MSLAEAVSAAAVVVPSLPAVEESAPLVDEEGAPVPATHRAHCERWAPRAAQTPAEKLQSPNIEGSVSYANADLTVRRLTPYKARVQALTHLDQTLIWELPSIALGYLYASALVRTTEEPKAQLVGPLLREVRGDKQLLLRVALALAAGGKLAEEKVEAIVAGRGHADTVADVVDLCILLRGVPGVVQDGGLLTAARLTEAEERAVVAQRLLRPTNVAPAPGVTDEQRAALVLLRNQLWTLLVQAHDEALLAAAHLVGVRRVNELVPSLGSRLGTPRGQAEVPQQPTA